MFVENFLLRGWRGAACQRMLSQLRVAMKGPFLRCCGPFVPEGQLKSQRVRRASTLDPGGEGSHWRGKWEGSGIWKASTQKLKHYSRKCSIPADFLQSYSTPWWQGLSTVELVLTWGATFITSSPGFTSGCLVASPSLHDWHVTLTGSTVDLCKPVLQLCVMH